MKILVVNAGSSSLKYQLFDMTDNSVLAKGICEKIGITPESGSITHKRPGAASYTKDTPVNDHIAAINLVLATLTDPELGVIKDISEISAVGHRFVHGGARIKESCVIDEDIVAYVESTIPINPLHAPATLKGYSACRQAIPSVPHIGVFDTSFYANMPASSYTYAIPYEWLEKHNVRRYGFHGTSHRYVSAEAAKIVGKPLEELKVITCHIGSGSSVTAIDHGVAVDTSMGFAPQGGLPMGTRCGPIDPSIVTFMIRQGLTPDEVDNILNKKSGLIGVSGVSSDARDVWAAIDAGNERAKLAMDLLVHYARKLIGGYVAEMNGADVIVITAGMGENDRRAREAIFSNLDALGLTFDAERNMSAPRGEVAELSADGSKVKLFVIPTDEELMIAKDTQRLAEAYYANK